MAKLPVTRRSLVFGAAMWFAGALGFWHIRSEGLATGLLNVGGKGGSRIVVRELDPSSFEAWATFFAVGSVVMLLFGIANSWLAWRVTRKRE